MKYQLIAKKFMSVLLVLIMFFPFSGTVMARGSEGMPILSALVQGPNDAVEMEAFLDDLLAQQMEEYHIAGAAVSIVKDGKLFFTKGYGYADLENKIPVDPEQTIFRIGSAGKLFTWTAVMQLVEQGKLDLDADVNVYLDFRIPNTYPQPITLKHLLTHTAGFEDLYFETFTRNTSETKPVGEWLATHIPARVRPPGVAAAYSNYGAMLAGYIVSRVSGQTYEQYIQEHIFGPLGMTHSTALWVMPSDLRAHKAVGYFYKDGVFQPTPNENDYSGQSNAMAPAGVHASSVMDVARFMIAYLQGGRYSDTTITDARILKDSTARQIQSTLYTPDPRLRGTAYGIFDLSDNGQWTLGHDGSTLGFNTMLLLLPDQNLGAFVAYNADDVGNLTRQHFGFQRAFFDHYYPAPAVESIQPPADFAERADHFVGSYLVTRSAYTTLEKYRNIMGALEVKNPGDGTLLVSTPWGKWKFVEVEPLFFRQTDGSFHMLFREDNQGHITYMFLDVAPQLAFEKINWYETPAFNIALLMVSFLIFLAMLPVAVIRFLRERRLSEDQKPSPRRVRVAYWLIVGISILNLLFVIGSAMWLDPNANFGVATIYKFVLGLGVLSAILTAAALVYGVLAWKDGYWSVAFRMFYTLLTVTAVAFVWFLNYWNLLGWRY